MMRSTAIFLAALLLSTAALCEDTNGRIGQVKEFEKELEKAETNAETNPSAKQNQTPTEASSFSTFQKQQTQDVKSSGEGQAEEGRTLEQAVAHVAGPERSLILAVTSSTYLDFVQNWMLSVSKFGQGSRVLFMAEDKEAFDFLSSRWPKQAYFSGRGRHHVGDATKNSNFSSPYFQSIVDRKPEYISKILAMNVSLLFNDMDMVWLADPYPYFTGDFDMWIQEDGVIHTGQDYRFRDGRPQKPIFDLEWSHSICTCFMMIRPTEASKQIIQAWKRKIEDKANRTNSPVHDQPELHALLKQTSWDRFKVGVLNVNKFPSGCLYFGGLCDFNQHRSFRSSGGMEKTVVVHNNWIEGHDAKLQRFKENGLWFLKEGKPGGRQTAKQ